jgi:hypothetical protein
MEAMEASTWKAIEDYRQTGLLVPIWRDGQVVCLSADEALATRPDYERRVKAKQQGSDRQDDRASF